MSKPLVEFALDYARRGWNVFPCKPSNKAPYTGSGLNAATTDPDIIRDWWQHWPHAMIGVRMGQASGVWALDPDMPDKPGAADGLASWRGLVAKRGGCPATHSHLTPRGGLHLLFQWRDDRPITNSEGQLKGLGINVRGEGGYIIAPPSRRNDNRSYEHVEPLDFFNFAEAPDWLYEIIMAKPLATISERASATVHRPVSRMVSALPYAEAALRGEYQEVAATGTGDRNARLNVAALKLGGLVAAGELSETEVVNTLYDAATANGMVADDGPRAAVATINSGMRKGLQEPRRIPERETKLEVLKPEPRAILATPYIWKDPTSLRRREWLYGYLLIRKFVTATVAPGGVGKSSLGTVESLAQVTGKDLLGVLPPRPLRVWLWNLEDPQEETERKIQAAAMHYGLTAEDIGDRLFVDSGRDQPLVIATTTRNGAVIAHPVVDSLVAEIIKRKIDVIKIDPFVSCHEASENDNQAMDLIVKEWGRVADRANCAVELYDHTRKMGGTETEVTVESSRGAKSKTDACRVVRAINRMTKDEGARAGIENHRLYFKTFNDKANLQPPADKAEWFELVSVDLGNGPLHGPGDSVGVVTKWEWPDPLAGMTGGAFDKVAASIRAGKFRESPQANAWVGNAVAEALDLNAENRADKAKIIRMLKVWLSAGSLVAVEDYDDTRRLRKFIEVRAE